MSDPTKTLSNILTIIDKDVKGIKNGKPAGRIAPEDALTLTRYASTLDSIVKNKEKEEEKMKKEFNRLPTEELIKAYEAEKKK